MVGFGSACWVLVAFGVFWWWCLIGFGGGVWWLLVGAGGGWVGFGGVCWCLVDFGGIWCLVWFGGVWEVFGRILGVFGRARGWRARPPRALERATPHLFDSPIFFNFCIFGGQFHGYVSGFPPEGVQVLPS